MYKHSASSSVITPSFSSSLSLSHSIHFLHMSHPSLPPLSFPLSSILTLSLHGLLRLKFACKVMKSHRRTPVPCRTHPPLIWIWIAHSHHSHTHWYTHTHTHVCAYSTFKTQTYFPINNACWSYCSQRSRESKRMSERRKNPEEDGAHRFTKLKILTRFKNEIQLQLGGDDPLYPNNNGGQ